MLGAGRVLRLPVGPALRLLLLRLALPLALLLPGLRAAGAGARHVDDRGHHLGRRPLLLHLDGGERAAPDVVAVDVVGVGPAAVAALAAHQVEPGVDAAVELVERVDQQGLQGHRRPGRPVLELAVVGQHDVHHVLLEVARHPGPAGLVVDPLRRHHQVADQPPLVGVLDLPVVAELADLGQVVEEGAGHQQVAVHLRVVIGQAVGQLEAGDGVLQQPARVGVVDALGGRGPAQADHHVLVLEEGVHQRLHVRVGDGVDEGGELPPQRLLLLAVPAPLRLLGLGGRRPGEVGRVDGGGVGRLHQLHAELRLALERAHQAAHRHVGALLEQRRELVHAVERARLQLTRLVLERHRQISLAALGGGDGLAGDEEDAAHRLALLHVLDPDLVHGPRKLAQRKRRYNTEGRARGLVAAIAAPARRRRPGG